MWKTFSDLRAESYGLPCLSLSTFSSITVCDVGAKAVGGAGCRDFVANAAARQKPGVAVQRFGEVLISLGVLTPECRLGADRDLLQLLEPIVMARS